MLYIIKHHTYIQYISQHCNKIQYATSYTQFKHLLCIIQHDIKHTMYITNYSTYNAIRILFSKTCCNAQCTIPYVICSMNLHIYNA